MEPLLKQQIGAYAPTALLPLDMHLVGRPEYLDNYSAGLQALIGGQILRHALPNGLTHLDVVKLEYSQVWVDVVRQLSGSTTINMMPQAARTF